MLLVVGGRNSPDQTASGSEFNAAEQKKHALTNGGCTLSEKSVAIIKDCSI